MLQSTRRCWSDDRTRFEVSVFATEDEARLGRYPDEKWRDVKRGKELRLLKPFRRIGEIQIAYGRAYTMKRAELACNLGETTVMHLHDCGADSGLFPTSCEPRSRKWQGYAIEGPCSSKQPVQYIFSTVPLSALEPGGTREPFRGAGSVRTR